MESRVGISPELSISQTQRLGQLEQMRGDVIVEQAVMREFEGDARKPVVPLPGENEYFALTPQAEYGKVVAMRGREKSLREEGVIFGG